MTDLSKLAPHPVWRHFQALCAIPRGSGGEAMVSDHLRRIGEGLGLETHQDALGDILIRKPGQNAAPDAPVVALQAHMDMVWAKAPGAQINFRTDPIRPVIDGDWVRAEGATLGADNGLGLAMALAVLEDAQIAHPPLEALFTVDEEVGMTGAESIAPGTLRAACLINIDSEDDSALTIGCAGAIDLVAEGACPTEAVWADSHVLELRLSGGAGGHSGLEIDRNRLNAAKLLAACAIELAARLPIQLHAFEVPGVANVIPGAGALRLGVAADQAETAARLARAIVASALAPFARTDPQARIEVLPAAPADAAFAEAFQIALLEAVQTCPNGVLSMSDFAEGLVEGSSNLAHLTCVEGRYEMALLLRSSCNAQRPKIAADIRRAFAPTGLEIRQISDQPSWRPQPDSRLRRLVEAAYTQETGRAPRIETVHAGLECGCFSRNFPDLQMISLGPNIRGAHSPGECVQISSVARIWAVLARALDALARNGPG